MRLSDFDYELPPERIAQEPARPRDDARLCVYDPAAEATTHARFRDFPGFLHPGDLVIANDTRVRNARLAGARRSGGAVELLLLGRVAGGAWRALAHPAGRLKVGEEIELEGGVLRARMLERPRDAEGVPLPEWLVELETDTGELEQAIERYGRAPLPPYIHRPRGDDPLRARDRSDYQTLFARELGAVAAPTAGLHFTPAVVSGLAARGVELARLTLHVGEGTFRSVECEDPTAHEMHEERFSLPAATAAAVEACRARGGRVVAVGTTTTRVLETCATAGGVVEARSGATRLFIAPGFRFRVVDALVTNFHLPRSTLLMLVSAFVGRESVLRLYRDAIERGYRFYSYGDATFFAGRRS